MKKRCAAILLCCTLFVFPNPAWADSPFTGGGHLYYRSHTYTPAAGAHYTVNSLRHTQAGLEEEHILSFTPNAGLKPVVISPDTLYGNGLTIDEAIEKAKARGYDVIGAVNANYFNSNMTPTGLQIRDGVITSLDPEGLPSVGFTDSGETVIGIPAFTVTVSGTAGSVKIDRLNKARNPDLVYMYTRDFSSTTQTTQEGTHVVLKTSGKLTPGGYFTGTVTQVITGKSAYTMASDEMVLSASSKIAIDRLAFLTEGSTVTVTVGCSDPRWNAVKNAAGGTPMLIKDGKNTNQSDGARAPRTAVGITAEGKTILYTVDGRQSGYSAGLTLTELASRMLDLGCVTAFSLDGGGSTAMSVRMPGEASSGVVNKISNVSQRKCADYIVLCNTAPITDGKASLLFPKPSYVTMMPNSTVSFSFLATDISYRPATMPYSPVLSAPDNPETGISSGNTFTALYPGVTTITFQSGTAVGTAKVNVTSRLDTLTLKDLDTGLSVTEMVVSAGQTVRFNATGTLDNAEVISEARSFLWSVEGDIGSISPDGVFTASSQLNQTGRIVVTGGGKTVVLPVTVGKEPWIVEDFENGLGILSEGSGGLTASITNNINITERGYQSAALSYSFTQTSPSAQTISISGKLPASPPMLHLLVTGDGSGHELIALITSVTGSVSQISMGKLDFKGLKVLSAKLPSQSGTISGLMLIPKTDAARTGTFYLHQIITTWTETLPQDPPSIQISNPVKSGEELIYTVTVLDHNGTVPNEVEIRWDGIPVENLIWDTYTGRTEVRVPLPYMGLHILSVDACDQLGLRERKLQSDNYGRGDSLSSICDTVEGSWYTGYVDFLDQRGIVGTTDISGLRFFYPMDHITRLEVFQMLAKTLNLDLISHQNVFLPFDDMSSLSDEDTAVVKAVYEAGLISGKPGKDNTLLLDPEGKITRGELFTLLRKTLPGGYKLSSLQDFSDTSSVPAFALSSIKVLAGMGIISGFEGKLNSMDSVTKAETASLFCRFFF